MMLLQRFFPDILTQIVGYTVELIRMLPSAAAINGSPGPFKRDTGENILLLHVFRILGYILCKS